MSFAVHCDIPAQRFKFPPSSTEFITSELPIRFLSDFLVL
jgi:hypothetical protein